MWERGAEPIRAAAARDGGATESVRNAVGFVATDDVWADIKSGLGFHSKDALRVHFHLQRLIVGRSDEMGSRGGSGIAGYFPGIAQGTRGDRSRQLRRVETGQASAVAGESVRGVVQGY